MEVRDFDTTTLRKYYVHANAVIRKSGQFNYQFCRFPVPTAWDLDRFEQLLVDSKYEDLEIVQFLRFGWPIEVNNLMINPAVPINQKGALESSAELLDYINTEISNRSVIGPFNINVFGNSSRISPIDAIPKKDSDEKRIILNLSHPPDGTSVNDAVSKDQYLGKRYKSYVPKC